MAYWGLMWRRYIAGELGQCMHHPHTYIWTRQRLHGCSQCAHRWLCEYIQMMHTAHVYLREHNRLLCTWLCTRCIFFFPSLCPSTTAAPSIIWLCRCFLLVIGWQLQHGGRRVRDPRHICTYLNVNTTETSRCQPFFMSIQRTTFDCSVLSLKNWAGWRVFYSSLFYSYMLSCFSIFMSRCYLQHNVYPFMKVWATWPEQPNSFARCRSLSRVFVKHLTDYSS